jgi:hypothetical protein
LLISLVLSSADFMSYCDCIADLTFPVSTLSGEALGQRSFPPPYLAPNSSAAMTNSGINYTSGSSGIFDETGSFYVCKFLDCVAVMDISPIFLAYETSL